MRSPLLLFQHLAYVFIFSHRGIRQYSGFGIVLMRKVVGVQKYNYLVLCSHL